MADIPTLAPSTTQSSLDTRATVEQAQSEQSEEASHQEKRLKEDNVEAGDASGETIVELDSAPADVCIMCSNAAKYTCPGCRFRTCSLACVNAHKTTLSCNGRKPPSRFIPKSQMNIDTLSSDLKFLKVVESCVGRSTSDTSHTARSSTQSHGAVPSLPHEGGGAAGTTGATGGEQSIEGNQTHPKHRQQQQQQSIEDPFEIEKPFDVTSLIPSYSQQHSQALITLLRVAISTYRVKLVYSLSEHSSYRNNKSYAVPFNIHRIHKDKGITATKSDHPPLSHVIYWTVGLQIPHVFQKLHSTSTLTSTVTTISANGDAQCKMGDHSGTDTRSNISIPKENNTSVATALTKTTSSSEPTTAEIVCNTMKHCSEHRLQPFLSILPLSMLIHTFLYHTKFTIVGQERGTAPHGQGTQGTNGVQGTQITQVSENKDLSEQVKSTDVGDHHSADSDPQGEMAPDAVMSATMDNSETPQPLSTTAISVSPQPPLPAPVQDGESTSNKDVAMETSPSSVSSPVLYASSQGHCPHCDALTYVTPVQRQRQNNHRKKKRDDVQSKDQQQQPQQQQQQQQQHPPPSSSQSEGDHHRTTPQVISLPSIPTYVTSTTPASHNTEQQYLLSLYNSYTCPHLLPHSDIPLDSQSTGTVDTQSQQHQQQQQQPAPEHHIMSHVQPFYLLIKTLSPASSPKFLNIPLHYSLAVALAHPLVTVLDYPKLLLVNSSQFHDLQQRGWILEENGIGALLRTDDDITLISSHPHTKDILSNKTRHHGHGQRRYEATTQPQFFYKQLFTQDRDISGGTAAVSANPHMVAGPSDNMNNDNDDKDDDDDDAEIDIILSENDIRVQTHRYNYIDKSLPTIQVNTGPSNELLSDDDDDDDNDDDNDNSNDHNDTFGDNYHDMDAMLSISEFSEGGIQFSLPSSHHLHSQAAAAAKLSNTRQQTTKKRPHPTKSTGYEAIISDLF